MPTLPHIPVVGAEPGYVEPRSIQEPENLGLLHVSVGLLLERYFSERDPCVAIWLSHQFRLISESSTITDAELKSLYVALADRWRNMALPRFRKSNPVFSLPG